MIRRFFPPTTISVFFDFDPVNFPESGGGGRGERKEEEEWKIGEKNMRNIFNPTKWPKVRRGAQTARSSAFVIGKPEAAETDFLSLANRIQRLCFVSILFPSLESSTNLESRSLNVRFFIIIHWICLKCKVILIEKNITLTYF